MDNEYTVNLGYACINNELRDLDIFTSRSVILKTFDSKGLDYIKAMALENVDDLIKILIFNEAHGIRFFRISSCIFPHLGNPSASFQYDIEFAKEKFKLVGNLQNTLNIE